MRSAIHPSAKSIFRGRWIGWGAGVALLLGAIALSVLAWLGWGQLLGGQGKSPAGLLAAQAWGPAPHQPAPLEPAPPTKTESADPSSSAGQPKADSDSAWPTHPLIQALLDTLEAFHGAEAEAKTLLRDRLHQADHQLSSVLRGRKQRILQANRKLVLPQIEERLAPPASKQQLPTAPTGPQSGKGSSGEASADPSPSSQNSSTFPSPSRPPAGTSTAPRKSSAHGQKSPQQGSASSQVQSALVRSLLDTLEMLPEVSEEQKHALRELLLEADQELAQRLPSPSGKLSPPPPPVAPTGPPK